MCDVEGVICSADGIVKKYSGKRKAEVNFCGRYQSWRAPWIVIESSAGSKIAWERNTAVWEGAEGLFFSRCLILSLCFLRGGLVIEQCVLPGCGPPPAVISSDIESNNHATNHPGSSLTLSVDWKETVGLSQHQCWFTAPGSLHCPRADLCRLCGFVCQEMRAACRTWPDAQWKDDLTTIGLWCVLKRSGQGRSLFPCQGLGGHREVVPPHSRDITAQIKHCCCFGLIQIKMLFWYLITVHVLSNKTGIWRIQIWIRMKWNEFQAFPQWSLLLLVTHPAFKVSLMGKGSLISCAEGRTPSSSSSPWLERKAVFHDHERGRSRHASSADTAKQRLTNQG